MRKTLSAFSALIIVALLAGCAGSKASLKDMTSSSSHDVFREVTTDAPPAAGYVDLKISSSLKTHKVGYHSETDVHGTEEYLLLVKIDGQVITLKGNARPERRELHSPRDPEEGEGVRYEFIKNLRLKPGPHKIMVALPADGVVAAADFSLEKGKRHDLVIEPLYRAIPGREQPGYTRKNDFREGIRCLVLVLDGTHI